MSMFFCQVFPREIGWNPVIGFGSTPEYALQDAQAQANFDFPAAKNPDVYFWQAESLQVRGLNMALVRVAPL